MTGNRNILHWRSPGYVVGSGTIDYERAGPRGCSYRIRLCGGDPERCYLSVARYGKEEAGVDQRGREVPHRALESLHRSRQDAVAAAAQHEWRGSGGPAALEQALLQRRMRRRYERS